MAFPGMPMGNQMGSSIWAGTPPSSSSTTPLPDLAMSSLDQVMGQQNSSAALQKTSEILSLAHKLLMSVLPQISNTNPRVAKDLHQISQRVLQVQEDMQRDMPVGEPPAELMALLEGDEAPEAGGVPGPPLPSPSPMMPGM